MSLKSILATSALLAAQLVAGHSVITNAVGNAGGSGMALGVDTSTPRDGTRRNPFQQDATRFRGDAADSVGETVSAGTNNLESGTTAIMSETGDKLPQITAGGQLSMTLHQVNADGAGPYTCMINSDGTAQSWENIQVTQNVDGNNRGRNNAGNTQDHPLVAAIPAAQKCTGTVAGQQDVCLIKCMNPARAGPFGGVVPAQLVNGASGTPPAGGNAPPAAGDAPAAPVATPGGSGAGKAGNPGKAGNANKGNNNNQNEGKRAVEFNA